MKQTPEQIKHALERIDKEIEKRVAQGEPTTFGYLYRVARSRNTIQDIIVEMAQEMDMDDIFTC